ncbi:hypothetical protein CCACVL1_04651, partial [Corchorus capsularis]
MEGDEIRRRLGNDSRLPKRQKQRQSASPTTRMMLGTFSSRTLAFQELSRSRGNTLFGRVRVPHNGAKTIDKIKGFIREQIEETTKVNGAAAPLAQTRTPPIKVMVVRKELEEEGEGMNEMEK